MKKVLVVVFLSLMFCSIGLAESYYFKECEINKKISANYLIDFHKNEIKNNLNNLLTSYNVKVDYIQSKLKW